MNLYRPRSSEAPQECPQGLLAEPFAVKQPLGSKVVDLGTVSQNGGYSDAQLHHKAPSLPGVSARGHRDADAPGLQERHRPFGFLTDRLVWAANSSIYVRHQQTERRTVHGH